MTTNDKINILVVSFCVMGSIYADRDRLDESSYPKKPLPKYIPSRPKKPLPEPPQEYKVKYKRKARIYDPAKASYEDVKRRLTSIHTKVFSKDEVVRFGIPDKEKKEWYGLLDGFAVFVQARYEKGSRLSRMSKKSKKLFTSAFYEMRILSSYLLTTINKFNNLFFKKSQADLDTADLRLLKINIKKFKEKLFLMDVIEKSLKTGLFDGKETKAMKDFLKTLLLFIKVTYKKILNEKVFGGKFKIGGDDLKKHFSALVIGKEAMMR